MNRSMKTLILLAALTLSACKLDSGSSSPPPAPSADLSHLYLVLKAPNAAAFSAVQARAVESVNRGSTAVTPQAVTLGTCPGIGTIINDDPSSPSWNIKTCTGSYANLSEALTADDVSTPTPPLGNYQVFFDQPNCKGLAYTRESPGISSKAIGAGYLFLMDMDGTGALDPGTWWYVVPATTATSNVTIVSFFNGTCQASSATIDAFPVKLNSEAVDGSGNPLSGIPSVPIQGPLGTGTP